MRIALLQYPVLWADIRANLKLWEERIRPLAGLADVALLPEMCTTGFCTDRPELAEPEDGPTIHRMQALADECDLMVCGSYICRVCDVRGERLVNRGFMLRPHSEPVYIDKRHLYHHEKTFFSAGNQRSVIEWRGAKFRYIICYDLRFPTWDRIDKTNPYDILLISANWPDIRIHDFDILVEARGTENQAYVAAVNIVGDDPYGLHYNGHSVAYNTRHQDIAAFADDEAATHIVDLDIDVLHHFRKALPLYLDAD